MRENLRIKQCYDNAIWLNSNNRKNDTDKVFLEVKLYANKKKGTNDLKLRINKTDGIKKRRYIKKGFFGFHVSPNKVSLQPNFNDELRNIKRQSIDDINIHLEGSTLKIKKKTLDPHYTPVIKSIKIKTTNLLSNPIWNHLPTKVLRVMDSSVEATNENYKFDPTGIFAIILDDNKLKVIKTI